MGLRQARRKDATAARLASDEPHGGARHELKPLRIGPSTSNAHGKWMLCCISETRSQQRCRRRRRKWERSSLKTNLLALICHNGRAGRVWRQRSCKQPPRLFPCAMNSASGAALGRSAVRARSDRCAWCAARRVAALAVVDWSAGASVNRLCICERRSDVEAKKGLPSE